MEVNGRSHSKPMRCALQHHEPARRFHCLTERLRQEQGDEQEDGTGP